MLLLYASSVFLGASLVFLVQPMVGKMVLPLLGGSASVWNACMLFFQVALLSGYALAHGIGRVASPVRQVAVYGVLLAAAGFVLPVGLPSGWAPSPDRAPVAFVLGALVAGTGGPFVVVSAAAPLLQSWLAGTRERAAKDPYFLYAASNAGSFLALLAYPALIERSLAVADQRRLWTAGYVAFGLLALACGGFRLARPGEASAGSKHGYAEPLTWKRRGLWAILAFVPSSLMLAVTQHLTTDLSPFPALWAVTLAIYLLTYVLAFSRWGPAASRLSTRLVPWAAACVAASFLLSLRGLLVAQVLLHLALLALVGVASHGRLASDRPSAGRLTEFYLIVAVGGACGGVFNTIVAPSVFPTIAEYPIAVALGCLLLPYAAARAAGASSGWRRGLAISLEVLGPLAIAVAAVVLTTYLQVEGQAFGVGWDRWIAALVPAAASLSLARRRWTFSAAIALLAFLPQTGLLSSDERIHLSRTFFGVHQVFREATSVGNWHHLWNGATRHGSQFDREPLSRAPTTYYASDGPIGDVMRWELRQGPARNVAVVGLGVGTLAAYGRPPWRFTFYEIDPGVVRIARDPALFTYLSTCPSQVTVVEGDGRIGIAGASDGVYDLIVLDAFSSDAIPVHLITREAVELYLRKLRPGGLLAFHITNRYVDLSPVLAGIADELHLAARFSEARAATEQERLRQKSRSRWLVMSRALVDLGPLATDARWVTPVPRPGARVWTDDFSDVLGTLVESLLRRGR